ncbi:hypothetical protein B7R25_03510 [Subtercola boreus]|uniref:Uncharacterized protein n=2 Tax=Subtercola boreus TaxID=120213 RepID=A0A3E0WDI3_9MICO|nr:hypothetical protein [Subtercola boreus]RFA22688.1 hypothetical protein B7R24_03500 [Subtercola boreus]RFA23043.1 hypothetical protein B7R23_03495 [Subtercola boreus]RFA28796.1 hypothetical protein B7R25_03510 [Subtercola boreus]
MSAEHLYDLVNQTLLANFGPLGSYAITRRERGDSDDIFHTMLASSVAHNIVGNLINHSAIPLQPQPALGGSFVAATSAFAASHALPSEPLPASDLPPLREGMHAGPAAAAPERAVSTLRSEAPAPVSAAAAPATAVHAPVAAAVPVASSAVPVDASQGAVPTFTAPIIPFPIAAVTAPAGGPASLAPIVAVPVSADLAQALTALDQTGPIGVAGPQLPAPRPAVALADTAPGTADRPLVSTER